MVGLGVRGPTFRVGFGVRGPTFRVEGRVWGYLSASARVRTGPPLAITYRGTSLIRNSHPVIYTQGPMVIYPPRAAGDGERYRGT